jgi:hypothetical protein
VAVGKQDTRKEPTPGISPLNSLAQMRCYYIVISCLLALFALLEFVDLDAEYDSMGWTIQHDEKLVVPDARSLYLGRDQKLSDYREPASAGFGILGPYLTSLGFRLFGLNNYGLRFVCTVISVASMSLLALSLLRLYPSWLGVLFCVVNLINYRYFVTAHYALIEDILIFSLCGLAWGYLTRPKTVLAMLNPLAFFGGVLFLFKQVFPFYWLSLLGCITLSERVSRRRVVKFVSWSLAGVIVFGSLQLFVLHQMGMLSVFTHNISRAVQVFAGGSTDGVSLQVYPEAPGLVGIVPRYVQQLVSWYQPVYIHPHHWFGWEPISHWQYSTAMLLFFGLMGATVWLLRKKRLSNRTMALGMFLVVMLVVLSPMFFYVKRALPLFPITFLFLASLLGDMLNGSPGTRTAKALTRAALWCTICFVIYYVIWQGAYVLVKGPALRSHGVEWNSRALEELVPEKTAVYMHCYGLRFFWQARRRIISGDDQLMNNEMILAKALREKARFVLLSDRGGTIGQGESLDCPPFKIRKRHLYFSEMTDSGYPMFYVLYELAYGEGSGMSRGAQPS